MSPNLCPCAGDLVHSLTAAGQEVPQALADLASKDGHFRKGLGGGGRRGGRGGRGRGRAQVRPRAPHEAAEVKVLLGAVWRRHASQTGCRSCMKIGKLGQSCRGPIWHGHARPGSDLMGFCWLVPSEVCTAISLQCFACDANAFETICVCACQVGGAGLGFGAGRGSGKPALGADAAPNVTAAPSQAATPAAARAQASFESGFARGGLESTVEGTDPTAAAHTTAAATPAQAPLPGPPAQQNGSAAAYSAAPSPAPAAAPAAAAAASAAYQSPAPAQQQTPQQGGTTPAQVWQPAGAWPRLSHAVTLPAVSLCVHPAWGACV
jgi:hypothetical protein